MILLQVDFKYTGPTGHERDKALEALAHSITQEPGFLWKIWTEDEAAERAGGIYLFRTRKDAEAYLAMHSRRLLARPGVSDLRGFVFEVNDKLTAITRGPTAI